MSNENKGIENNRKEVKDFIEKHSLSKVTSLTLNEIMEYISDKPKDITAKFIIESHSVMQFQEKQLSSSVSYLVKLSLIDLIRITCKSEELRNDPSISDYKNLEGQELEMSLLYDNVRGYLGDTKFNKNIIETIEDEPEKFFMYNNGLTMTSKNITASTINAGKRFSCKLKDFQIVNGGQTIRSIYKFLKEKFNEEKLSSAKVLVRIFKTEEDNELTNNIAEYTNSQNKINSVNLKSISNIQIKIERFLREYGINYVRKAGDIGVLEKSNKQKNKDKTDSKKQRRVPIELLAQLLFSKMGNPDKATNQKSKLFDKYYDDIFNSNLNFDEVIEIIELYFLFLKDIIKFQVK